jgi:hypothetical protein
MTNIESKLCTYAELGAVLDAFMNDKAERERLFVQGCVMIFEAIYGPFGPRLRADLADRFECLLFTRETKP